MVGGVGGNVVSGGVVGSVVQAGVVHGGVHCDVHVRVEDGGVWPVPRQLPAPPGWLIGRDAQRLVLDRGVREAAER